MRGESGAKRLCDAVPVCRRHSRGRTVSWCGRRSGWCATRAHDVRTANAIHVRSRHECRVRGHGGARTGARRQAPVSGHAARRRQSAATGAQTSTGTRSCTRTTTTTTGTRTGTRTGAPRPATVAIRRPGGTLRQSLRPSLLPSSRASPTRSTIPNAHASLPLPPAVAVAVAAADARRDHARCTHTAAPTPAAFTTAATTTAATTPAEPAPASAEPASAKPTSTAPSHALTRARHRRPRLPPSARGRAPWPLRASRTAVRRNADRGPAGTLPSDRTRRTARLRCRIAPTTAAPTSIGRHCRATTDRATADHAHADRAHAGRAHADRGMAEAAKRRRRGGPSTPRCYSAPTRRSRSRSRSSCTAAMRRCHVAVLGCHGDKATRRSTRLRRRRSEQATSRPPSSTPTTRRRFRAQVGRWNCRRASGS